MPKLVESPDLPKARVQAAELSVSPEQPTPDFEEQSNNSITSSQDLDNILLLEDNLEEPASSDSANYNWGVSFDEDFDYHEDLYSSESEFNSDIDMSPQSEHPQARAPRQSQNGQRRQKTDSGRGRSAGRRTARDRRADSADSDRRGPGGGASFCLENPQASDTTGSHRDIQGGHFRQSERGREQVRGREPARGGGRGRVRGNPHGFLLETVGHKDPLPGHTGTRLNRRSGAAISLRTSASTRGGRAGNGILGASAPFNGPQGAGHRPGLAKAAPMVPPRTVARVPNRQTVCSSSATGTTVATAPAMNVPKTSTITLQDIPEPRVANKPDGTLPGVVRGVTPVKVPVTNVTANMGTNNNVAAAHATDDLTSITSEQTRRARRAQRAVLIFQEQCQIRQAEDAAKEGRVCTVDSTVETTAALTSASTLSIIGGGKNSTAQPLSTTMTNMAVGVSSTSSTRTSTNPSASTSSTVCSAKFTEVVNTTHASPTPAQIAATTKTATPPVHATANSMQAPTFINKIISNPHIANKPTTIQPVLPLLPPKSTQKTCCVKSASSVSINTSTVVATMASVKVSNSLAGSDVEDGIDSDDGDFVMTRTAGKRRLNVSAADMIANEILDDVNEELVVEDEEVTDPIKRLHRGYMNEAVAMAQLALRTNETPVGCVLVHNGRVIARGMNATNMTRNGTRHAELMCINALLSYWDDVNKADEAASFGENNGDDISDCGSAEDYDDDKKEYTEDDWAKVDPSKGHLFPYGQKLHPARIVSQDIIHECSLYVTVEPCIMCASMLRQYGIKKVYFGAANDKFGGTGGVLRIHMNSKPNERVQQNVSYIETYVTNMMSRPKRVSRPPRTLAVNTEEAIAAAEDAAADSASSISPTDSAGSQEDGGTAKMTTTITRTVVTTDNTNNPPVVRHTSTIPIAEGAVPARDEGHGGNVEPGFDVEGGWGRDKAVFLLRQFYVQENGRAPAPRKKEGRAQRLVEQMKCETESTVKLPTKADGMLLDVAAAAAVAAEQRVSPVVPPAAIVPMDSVPMQTETLMDITPDGMSDIPALVAPANTASISDD